MYNLTIDISSIKVNVTISNPQLLGLRSYKGEKQTFSRNWEIFLQQTFYFNLNINNLTIMEMPTPSFLEVCKEIKMKIRELS